MSEIQPGIPGCELHALQLCQPAQNHFTLLATNLFIVCILRSREKNQNIIVKADNKGVKSAYIVIPNEVKVFQACCYLTRALWYKQISLLQNTCRISLWSRQQV